MPELARSSLNNGKGKRPCIRTSCSASKHQQCRDEIKGISAKTSKSGHLRKYPSDQDCSSNRVEFEINPSPKHLTRRATIQPPMKQDKGHYGRNSFHGNRRHSEVIEKINADVGNDSEHQLAKDFKSFYVGRVVDHRNSLPTSSSFDSERISIVKNSRPSISNVKSFSSHDDTLNFKRSLIPPFKEEPRTSLIEVSSIRSFEQEIAKEPSKILRMKPKDLARNGKSRHVFSILKNRGAPSKCLCTSHTLVTPEKSKIKYIKSLLWIFLSDYGIEREDRYRSKMNLIEEHRKTAIKLGKAMSEIDSADRPLEIVETPSLHFDLTQFLRGNEDLKPQDYDTAHELLTDTLEEFEKMKATALRVNSLKKPLRRDSRRISRKMSRSSSFFLPGLQCDDRNDAKKILNAVKANQKEVENNHQSGNYFSMLMDKVRIRDYTNTGTGL